MPVPPGFFLPCPKAPQPLTCNAWLHEIKHDGFRIVARKERDRVRLYSRPGNDLTDRFPLIVEGLGELRSRSCILDGEAVACGDNGVPSFDCIRHRRHDAGAPLFRPHRAGRWRTAARAARPSQGHASKSGPAARGCGRLRTASTDAPQERALPPCGCDMVAS